MRLVICFYCFGCGDYYFIIVEMFEVGVFIVVGIIEDVCEVIINNFWNESVVNYFFKNE